VTTRVAVPGGAVVGRESVVAVHVRDRRLVGQLARPLVPIRPRQPVRDQRQHVLTLTSHTTNRKTPTDHAPETPAGSTHGDAVIPSQAAVNNCSVRLPRRSRAAMRSTLIRCGGGVFGSQRRKPGGRYVRMASLRGEAPSPPSVPPRPRKPPTATGRPPGTTSTGGSATLSCAISSPPPIVCGDKP